MDMRPREWWVYENARHDDGDDDDNNYRSIRSLDEKFWTLFITFIICIYLLQFFKTIIIFFYLLFIYFFYERYLFDVIRNFPVYNEYKADKNKSRRSQRINQEREVLYKNISNSRTLLHIN